MTANVLVVDDIESNIKLLEAKLLGEYYTVFTANNAKDALNVLAINRIDIILLDAMMPDMDGFETCRKIKSNISTMHIPVIMVTALSDTEDRIKGLEAGADEFLTKPIDDTALFARVRSLARMKAVIDELKLRNTTNAELGGSVIEIQDNFSDSKILLINDDIVQARNINKMLLTLTPNIKIISDIKELEKDTEYPLDLVIISCQLEQGDPLRISVMLRSNIKFHDIVLILQAEEENRATVIKGLELGINDYFMYPVDKNELLARIRTQLRRKHYQDKLRNDLELSVNLSIKDGLTGIFNRHYFDTHIKQMVKKADDSKRPLCLLMCDIDYFKQVNDSYGHQAGDVVLKTVANVLKNIFRVTDLIARYGGEEFAVLLNDITIDEAMYVAERVRTRVESIEFKVKTQENPIKKTISIGVTEYKIGETISDFIERADKALYQGKEQGRNRVIKIT
ncbi:PleD family two-component system response regulator [Rickettsia endosymbiont of Oedothorax gibbosus]|uniref:PleD family two-component system response regulator n=1 Tax=Rickettsia endosymbiont of Oedothorax gibbosus TaxID=931099 RepID=UPI0020253E32|nr:PleD family two-component system response regulator [Rickettsia endosymbiont of Oedothorax gibbosus]